MTRARQVDGPTSLYKCYAANGDLIYVGITFTIAARLKGHEHDKPWWNEVARIEIEYHDHRADASAEERRLIRAHLPKHNDCLVANAERARRGLPSRESPRAQHAALSAVDAARRQRRGVTLSPLRGLSPEERSRYLCTEG